MKNLFKALSQFQNDCPNISKDKKGYGYKYADLPSIIKTINPILKENNLSFTQILDGNNICTMLVHTESGESIKGSVEVPIIELKGMNVYQSTGSGITYFRRYALCSILGIVGDEDNDATGTKVTKQTKNIASKAIIDKIKAAMDKGDKEQVFKQAVLHYALNEDQLNELEMYKSL